jgi:hypothetical protein
MPYPAILTKEIGQRSGEHCPNIKLGLQCSSSRAIVTAQSAPMLIARKRTLAPVTMPEPFLSASKDL